MCCVHCSGVIILKIPCSKNKDKLTESEKKSMWKLYWIVVFASYIGKHFNIYTGEILDFPENAERKLCGTHIDRIRRNLTRYTRWLRPWNGYWTRLLRFFCNCIWFIPFSLMLSSNKSLVIIFCCCFCYLLLRALVYLWNAGVFFGSSFHLDSYNITDRTSNRCNARLHIWRFIVDCSAIVYAILSVCLTTFLCIRIKVNKEGVKLSSETQKLSPINIYFQTSSEVSFHNL